jgi:Na+-driven multidrug efflux pump
MSPGTIIILLLLVLFIYLALNNRLGSVGSAIGTLFPSTVKAK